MRNDLYIFKQRKGFLSQADSFIYTYIKQKINLQKLVFMNRIQTTKIHLFFILALQHLSRNSTFF